MRKRSPSQFVLFSRFLFRVGPFCRFPHLLFHSAPLSVPVSSKRGSFSAGCFFIPSLFVVSRLSNFFFSSLPPFRKTPRPLAKMFSYYHFDFRGMGLPPSLPRAVLWMISESFSRLGLSSSEHLPASRSSTHKLVAPTLNGRDVCSGPASAALKDSTRPAFFLSLPVFPP